METIVIQRPTWYANQPKGEWRDQDVFYPLEASPAAMLNDCGVCKGFNKGFKNDMGTVAEALAARDAYIDATKSKCDSEHPVAKKYKSTLGGKPWNKCYNDRMATYDATVANTTKFEQQQAKDAPINSVLSSLTTDGAGAGTSGALVADNTMTYVIGGVVFLAFVFGGIYWYKNRQVSAPAAA